MSSAETPRRGTRWLKWTLMGVLGATLAGVQIVLIIAAHYPYYWPLALVIALSCCSYLLCAFVERFLACRQGKSRRVGRVAGYRVVRVAFLLFAIAVVAYAIILLATPPPPCTSGPYSWLCLNFRPVIAQGLFTLVLLEALWAVLACALGRWLGGTLGTKGIR